MRVSNLTAVQVPISSEARYDAQEFGAEQFSTHKARRVFFNTLAVWSVHRYLELQHIPTDLTQGDSWNSLMRCCADVADLVIPGLGRLECRPVFGKAEACYFPPEIWWERVAHVVVQIDETCTIATLLGFLFRVEQVEVPVTALKPINELTAYLHQVTQASVPLSGKYVILRDWLDDRHTDDWVDARRLPQSKGHVVFRWKHNQPSGIRQGQPSDRTARLHPSNSGVARGKMVQIDSMVLPLILCVEAIASGRMQLCVQVFSNPDVTVLPPGLSLSIVDATGANHHELITQSRQHDVILQLQFSGAIGEIFQVVVGYNQTQVVKTFMI